MPLPSSVRAITPARQRGYRQKQDERNEVLGWVRMSLVVPTVRAASFRHAATVARAEQMHDNIAASETPASDPVVVEIAASSFARATTQEDFVEIERTIQALPKAQRADIKKAVDRGVDAIMFAENKRDEEYAKAETAKERARVADETHHAALAVAWSYTAAASLQEVWLSIPVVDIDDET